MSRSAEYTRSMKKTLRLFYATGSTKHITVSIHLSDEVFPFKTILISTSVLFTRMHSKKELNHLRINYGIV